MTRRVIIFVLVGALAAGILFFAGCQTPEEIAEVEAARASARAALADQAEPEASSGAGSAGGMVTLRSTTGTVRPPEEGASPPEESVPPETAAPVPPLQAPSTAPEEPAAAVAEDAPASSDTAPQSDADPYARTPVGRDYEVLRLGSEGPLVERLHLYLAELGYMPDAAGSTFGQDTEDAVIALQERNSLEPDGIVGNSTWDLLLMSNARPAA